jgi:hypothetical protein
MTFLQTVPKQQALNDCLPPAAEQCMPWTPCHGHTPDIHRLFILRSTAYFMSSCCMHTTRTRGVASAAHARTRLWRAMYILLTVKHMPSCASSVQSAREIHSCRTACITTGSL